MTASKKSPPDDLRSALRKDEAYVSFVNIAKMIRDRNNCDAIRQDIRTTVAIRTLPKLHLDTGGPTEMKLYGAQAKDIGVRSRLTEIREHLSVDQALLKRALEDMQAHLRRYYGDWLYEYGKRLDDQRLVTNLVLKGALRVKDDIDVTVGVIDHYIKDIDQASYGASGMIRVFERFSDLTRTPKYT